ncbi:putative uncharacterized protein [Phocaeicola coprophilus CAG:333]|nr:putative uncharacterized protein [Phocaeicola coprophilus CAG:333]
MADVTVALVLFYLQYGFRLVVQLRTDMPSRILIPLVLMQYRMDVYLPVVRPLHQLGYDACGFTGAIDVVHHITDAVYDYKTNVGSVVDRLFYNPDTLLRRVFSQSEKFKVLIVPVIRQAGHPQNACHDFQAMVRALLCINIKHFPLIFRQFRHIPQHCAVLQCGGYDSRYIECLFTFGFADGCAEIAQCPNDRTMYFEDFRCFLITFRQAQT